MLLQNLTSQNKEVQIMSKLIYIRKGALFTLFLSTAISGLVLASNQTGDSHPQQSSQAMSQAPRVGKRTVEQIEIISKRGIKDEFEIFVPGASYIKLHFSKFNVPRGLIVEVANPDGSESYQYSKLQSSAMTFDPRQGDDGKHSFSAMSISGDTAIVRVMGKRGLFNHFKHQVLIDYYMEGFDEDTDEVYSSNTQSSNTRIKTSGKTGVPYPLSSCGEDERYYAVCWEGSHPDEYDRSRPVAKLLIDGSSVCTAWRVGPENHMFTNNHCISDQDSLSNTEVWFNYERIVCESFEADTVVKVSASTLLATDWTLDYTLFTVSDFLEISQFGYLGIEIRDGILGEEIFIPQHGLGRPKQIAIESDMNVNGLCQIDDENHDARQTGSDLGYFCDSIGGASGSPVLLSSSRRAIALHHYGGCLNSGVKMSLIWPQVADYFDGVVPTGDDSVGNLTPVASYEFGCSGLFCNFDASGSSDQDGTIVGYFWDYGDGNTGSGTQVNHEYAFAGNYQVQLLVEDDGGASDMLTETVTVDTPNASPTAAFSVNCTDTTCSFDASLSSDSDGQIINYAWTFGDGFSGNSANPVIQHSFAQGGNYLVVLTVVDDQGANGQAQSTVTVTSTPINQAPVADFSFTCGELTCDFDASGSNDPDGSIVQYLWTFGTGESTESGGPFKQYEYAISGNYTVTLEVTDNLGASATTETTVFVPPVTVAIDLNVSTKKIKGRKSATLTWSGAGGSQVNVFRNGTQLTTTANDGEYLDSSLPKNTRSIAYQICETGPGAACSAEITGTF